MVKIVMGKKPAAAKSSAVPSAAKDLEGTARRLKIMEERFANMRSKVQVLEQNMLHKHKNFFVEIKTLNMELTEVKKEINELKDKIIIMVRELDSFAKKEEVHILKKYIDLWNPVKFVSKREVESIVHEVIEKMRRE